MRRILSITLLLLFGLPLLAPAFASATDARVPVCCRKGGVHHCMGMGTATQSGERLTTLQSRCPRYPKAVSVRQLQSLSFEQSVSVSIPVGAHPSGKAQTEARYRTAFSRSRQKRGPPQILV